MLFQLPITWYRKQRLPARVSSTLGANVPISASRLVLPAIGANVYDILKHDTLVLTRAAVDLLGADHVLMGTDWPIVEEKSVPERLARALAHSGLSPAEQQMVAGGNTLRLLGIA